MCLGRYFIEIVNQLDNTEVQTMLDRFVLNHKVRYKEGSFSTITELSQGNKNDEGKRL